MTSTDWVAWHDDYADPTSQPAQRLRVVQRAIEGHLDSSAPQDVRVVSACAGDGRDLLQVLERREDADRVSATLIEADTRNAARAPYRPTWCCSAGSSATSATTTSTARWRHSPGSAHLRQRWCGPGTAKSPT